MKRKIHLFSHNHSEKLLRDCNAFDEILKIAANINYFYSEKDELLDTLLMNKDAKFSFLSLSWEKEYELKNRQRFDFAKLFGSKFVAVEIEFRNSDTIANDFSKFNIQYCSDHNTIGVVVLPARELSSKIRSGAANFEKALDLLKGNFWSCSPAPVLLLGLTNLSGMPDEMLQQSFPQDKKSASKLNPAIHYDSYDCGDISIVRA